MKYYIPLSILLAGTALGGCAINSGLHSYDLPTEGIYQTELGSQVNVVKLTQSNLAILQPAQINLQRDYQQLFQQPQKNYRLNSGDILSIYLWAYPEISPAIQHADSNSSHGYQLDHNGDIQFPILGRYRAKGKTIQQINDELRVQLARYLKNPDVVARVLSYQSQRYSVQGQVAKAGEFFLTDQPTSVYTALSLAGGVHSQSGDNTAITLIRQGTSYPLNHLELAKAGYSLNQLFLRADDTLYVQARENQKIYVMGEANKNQALILREQGMTLGDILGESQGINPLSASASKIYVLRSQQNMTEIYHLDLSHFADLGLANQFVMQRNDIVYVDASGLARWQRIINQVLPMSNMIYSVDRLGQ